MRDGGTINPDVVFNAKLKELLSGELRTVVCDNGVWDSKAMDDVEEEQYGLLGLDRGDRPSFYSFCDLSMVTSKWV